ncbi:MAG: prolyl oligopeptidase family serine peptidase [Ramlibacter sp.]
MRKPSILKQALGAVVCFLVTGFASGPGWAQTAPGAAAASAPGTVPVEAFFQNPTIARARISPDARHVAYLMGSPTQRTQLVVLDTEKLTMKVVAGFTDSDIGSVQWVNEKRLVFTVDDHQRAVGDRYWGPGLFAVDADGSEFRPLVDIQWRIGQDMSAASRKVLDPNVRLLATMHGKDSDDILVTHPQYTVAREFDALTVLRLDTRTGHSETLSRPAKSWVWASDAQNVPRATASYDGDRAALHYLDPATKEWTKLAEWDRVRGGGIYPLAFTPDGTLYVRAHNGRDTSGIYRYDIAKKALDAEPVLSAKGYDFVGGLIQDRTGVLGIRYATDALGTVWLDDRLKKLQARLDARLPGTINIIDIPYRGEVPFVVVHVFSDVQPGMVLLYNTQTDKLMRMGTALPAIDPQKMAHRNLVHYKARDGLDIPAWLTLPPGAKADQKLPMVVLVHGGPWARSPYWEWEADSQFLASRGYAVLEPEFRGSTGFGSKHFKAGWKQWGLAMQNDIADGTRWALAQGTADPARVCIAGASYGGYAALMGLVNDPDLYRCGIEWAGVTDIDLMYSISVFTSDTSDDAKRFDMPIMIGDRVKDAQQLKATSPLEQAARIKQPLLMAYGGSDRRVPIEHGTKFRDAVQKTNADVEWIEYREEGHGWLLVKNRVDFWTRVEKFLDRNIGAK